MQKIRYVVALGIPLLALLSFTLVTAWTGPTAPPPGNNVAAPINVGTTDQVKNGGLGVNSLAVFGNSLFGGSTGSIAYLNFGTTVGELGYGIRDNGGLLEFKNSGGSWQSIQNILWTLCGGDCGGGGGGTPVSFSVNRGGTNQAVTPWTKIIWTNEDFDINNNFANSRFTPTVPGKYIFQLTAGCNTTTSICEVAIYKNGVNVADSWGGAVGGNYASGHVSVMLDMNGTTDYIETFVNGGNSTAVFGSIYQTNFSGALLSAQSAGDGVWTSSGNDTYNTNTGNVGIGTASSRAETRRCRYSECKRRLHPKFRCPSQDKRSFDRALDA